MELIKGGKDDPKEPETIKLKPIIAGMYGDLILQRIETELAAIGNAVRSPALVNLANALNNVRKGSAPKMTEHCDTAVEFMSKLGIDGRDIKTPVMCQFCAAEILSNQLNPSKVIVYHEGPNGLDWCAAAYGVLLILKHINGRSNSLAGALELLSEIDSEDDMINLNKMIEQENMESVRTEISRINADADEAKNDPRNRN